MATTQRYRPRTASGAGGATSSNKMTTTTFVMVGTARLDVYVTGTPAAFERKLTDIRNAARTKAVRDAVWTRAALPMPVGPVICGSLATTANGGGECGGELFANSTSGTLISTSTISACTTMQCALIVRI